MLKTNVLKKFVLTLSVAAAVVAVPSSAFALEFLFGFSGGSAAQLDVQLVNGGALTLTAVNQGWWSDLAGNDNTNTNYIVGDLDGTHHNNYFTFDFTLPDADSIVSASLKVVREIGLSDLGLDNHTYNLFDVSTSAADLANKVNSPDATIFGDLGSGVAYGSYVVSVAGLPSDVLSFSLNGAALAALSGANGSFSIGGTLTPGGVVADVPEPGTLALLAAFGVPATLVIRRRVRK